MKRIAPFIILWSALLVGLAPVTAAPATSDWPSLGYDGAQSNFNRTEKTLSAKNVLKLKVKWAAPIADASYPVVAGGRVYVPFQDKHDFHVRVLDAVTGKFMRKYSKDTQGGLLVEGTNLYIAGRFLQEMDLTTGSRVARIDATGKFSGSLFVYPFSDHKIVLAGFANRINSSIYTVDPTSNQVLHKLPSASAIAAISTGRILTSLAKGSVFYDEATGRPLGRPPYFGSNWFAGDSLGYVVASPIRKPATLYAFDGGGHRVWSQTVGPVLSTQNTDWPHAVGTNAIYVHTLKPQVGVEALDPATGHVLWTQRLANISQLVLANNVLLALTYSLGQPVRLVALRPATGKVIGAIVLSSGYYAFYAQNGLMVANGMVFLRAVGPAGSQLVALGL